MRCEGCKEEYSYAYRLRSFGYESDEGYIGHATADMECKPDIFYEWINAWNFEDQMFLPAKAEDWMKRLSETVANEIRSSFR